MTSFKIDVRVIFRKPLLLGENTSDQFVDLNKVMIFYDVTLAEVAVNK